MKRKFPSHLKALLSRLPPAQLEGKTASVLAHFELVAAESELRATEAIDSVRPPLHLARRATSFHRDYDCTCALPYCYVASKGHLSRFDVAAGESRKENSLSVAQWFYECVESRAAPRSH